LFLAKLTNGAFGADAPLPSKVGISDGWRVYPFDTAALAPGTWRFKVVLGDGKSYTTNVVVKD
jgi:hypothetical protein